jgi:hypothetical protein
MDASLSKSGTTRSRLQKEGRKKNVEIELTLEQREKAEPLRYRYTRMVNAGYVGRNQEEVRRHIEELAKKGIPGPKKTPTLYPVIPRMLAMDNTVEVYSSETCGEVEYVLLIKDEKTIYVGLGSDHTDRHLEETDIPRAKQICPNVISRRVWPLSEVLPHWDDLEIASRVVKDGQEILYQKGLLALILDPPALMGLARSKITGSLAGTVIYSGTLGTLTGGFVFGERFTARLTDPRMGRSLDLQYDILPLDYLSVD